MISRSLRCMTGCFVGLTESEILAIRDQARKDNTAGNKLVCYTVPSGISVQRRALYDSARGLSPQDVLLECRYALQKIDSDTYGRDLVTTRTRAKFA